MASTEDRIANLAATHLGISDRSMFDAPAGELGVNSIDAVNFLKLVNQEFGTNITGEEAAKMSNMRDLINHLDG